MSANKPTARQILIIDDHRLFSDGLKLILNQLSPDLAVSTEHNSNRVLSNIDSLTRFNLLLIDLQMPGLDGFALLEALNNRKSSVSILVISGTEHYDDVERAFSLGAMGFVPKSAPGPVILQGINTVLSGHRFVPEELIGKLTWQKTNLDNPRKTKSTVIGPEAPIIRPRQLEVLRLIRDGHPNAQIASILGISESAVKSHVSILFSALGVRNRTSCVQTAIQKGLL